MASIEIPGSVTKIGGGAFSGCGSLINIEIPDSVTKIECGTFCQCWSLESIEIPNSITEIGDNAFSHCTSLTSIEIPDSVTEIGEYAFLECSSLTSIELPESITCIKRGCFLGTRLKNIYIHEKIEEIDASAFKDCPIEYLSVSERNPCFSQEDGVLFNKQKTKLIKFAIKKNVDSYQIPENVECLDHYAFCGKNSCLKKLYIPYSVRKIGACVFEHSWNLTEIHIRVKDPNSIQLNNSFEYFDRSQCSLYVPIGTGYAYRHHPEFGKFKEVIIEP